MVFGLGSSRRSAPRHRVVIIGASFAGLSTARRLGDDFAVTVIDRRDAFEFTPNIHELISGFKKPDDLRLPLAPLLGRMGHVYRHDEVLSIDTAARKVSLGDGGSLEYDTLVVAIGGVDSTHGVAGVKTNAWPFKSVDQCTAIGRELGRLLDGASARVVVHVVISGGGLEGVEALGEVLRRYRGREELRLHLVEGRQRLLPTEPSVFDSELRRHCREQDVDVVLGARIGRVNVEAVELDDGRRIPSDLTLWTGGVTPPPLLASSGLAKENEWAEVKSSLESNFVDDVYVVGDAASPPTRVTKQAYHGLDMGALCAENISRRRRGMSPRDYVPSRKPTLIAFGDLDTYLVSGQLVLGGKALAPLKEGVYQLVMSQLAPPADVVGALELARRIWKGARGFHAPSLPSVASLRTLIGKPDVRVLSR